MASLYDTDLTITASLDDVRDARVPVAPLAMEPVVIVPYSNMDVFLSVSPSPEKLNDLSAISSPLPKCTS